MKRVVVLFSFLMSISMASAFGASRYHFCVVHNNADHPSITAVIQGLNDEAEIYNIKVTHFDPAFDPQKQISMIEDCISLKSDLIVVNAVDPEAVVSGIKKAHRAGIPVVMNNADTNDEGRKYTETYVGAAAVLQGHATGEAMVNTLPDGAKGVVIIGKPGQTDVVLRLQGVREALAKGNRKLVFLDEQPANWMPDQAMTVMQAFLTRYPPGQLDFVLALDDPMALGAMQAIKPLGRMNEIKIYGFNGNKQACDAIKNGEMEGTALSLSYLSGVNTIRAGYDVMKGRIVSKQIFSPTQQLIPANIDQWYSQCW